LIKPETNLSEKEFKEAMFAKDHSDKVKKEDLFTTSEKPNNKKLSNEIKISAILWNESNPVAIVNGEMKRIGDLIDSKKIIEIHPDKIILRSGNRTYILEKNSQ